MRAELLTIGDEILIGQITNTNSVWMAQELNKIGINVVRMTSVSDNQSDIIAALDEASKRADIVLITGGLGPTKDDVTKDTFCKYFETELILNQNVLADVTDFFAKRNKSVTETNRKQAEVPKTCRVIRNHNGTAPGMWMKKNNTIFISMPGVPYEMKEMMINEILPDFKNRFSLPCIYHKTILTQGIGESVLADLISDWEDNLKLNNISLAYLPSPGMVRLRLSSKGTDSNKLQETIEHEIEKVKPFINKFIYGYEEYGKEQPKLEEIIGSVLKAKNIKLALAESCTGGYISHLITSVAGSSEYYNGGVIPYHNQYKHNLLNVDFSIFEKYGAVSEECVRSMIKGIKEKFNANAAIAVSGIAGPTGATEDKPVGTTWIAVSFNDQTICNKFIFGDNRQRNIQMTAVTALNMLRKLILNIED